MGIHHRAFFPARFFCEHGLPAPGLAACRFPVTPLQVDPHFDTKVADEALGDAQARRQAAAEQNERHRIWTKRTPGSATSGGKAPWRPQTFYRRASKKVLQQLDNQAIMSTSQASRLTPFKVERHEDTR